MPRGGAIFTKKRDDEMNRRRKTYRMYRQTTVEKEKHGKGGINLHHTRRKRRRVHGRGAISETRLSAGNTNSSRPPCPLLECIPRSRRRSVIRYLTVFPR